MRVTRNPGTNLMNPHSRLVSILDLKLIILTRILGLPDLRPDDGSSHALENPLIAANSHVAGNSRADGTLTSSEESEVTNRSPVERSSSVSPASATSQSSIESLHTEEMPPEGHNGQIADDGKPVRSKSQ